MGKPVLLALGLASLVWAPLAGAQTLPELIDGLDTFAQEVPASLPFAGGAGIDWSNAYTGQLIDRDFPYLHLAVGTTLGFTTLPGRAISPLLVALGSEPVDLLPLPFAVANLRVGGLIFPFDLGFKAGYLPAGLGRMVDGYTFEYKNFGFDVRYSLVKSTFVLPDISVGGGINYLKSSVSTLLGETQVIPHPAISGATLTLTAPRLALDLESVDFEVKGQVSKTLVYIVTPYLGATASLGSARAKASVVSALQVLGSNYSDWNLPAITAFGFAKGGAATPFGFKVYGGTSVNILILKVDGQLLYNLTDGAVGLTLGARLQI